MAVHDRRLRGLEAMARDLRRNERRFKDVAEAASEGFWEMDAELRMRYLGDRIFETSGCSPARTYGKTRVEIAGPSQEVAREPEKWRQHLAMLDPRRPFRDFEYTVVHAGTGPLHVRTHGTPVFDEDGGFAGYRGTGCDVTARREAGLELRRLAVTGGHATGDRVLLALASTARERRRGLDFLGRLGGEDGVQAVGERLRLAMAEVRLDVDRQALESSVSGEAATQRPDDPDLAELPRRADLALYMAKEAGRDRVVPG